jgi:hypothetical protein
MILMNKNFGLKVIAIAGVSCLCLSGCFNTKEQENIPADKIDIPEVEDTVIEGDVKTKVDTVLARLKIIDLNKLSDEDGAKLYGIEDIDNYDIGVYTKVTEDDYQEIAIINMKDVSDAKDILMKVSARIANLNQEYKDNPEILAILQDSKNIIIKQEGTVQRIIISKNAEQISKKLDVQF